MGSNRDYNRTCRWQSGYIYWGYEHNKRPYSWPGRKTLCIHISIASYFNKTVL